eukprot:jgi/Chlat1/9172/Chrsp97S08454
MQAAGRTGVAAAAAAAVGRAWRESLPPRSACRRPPTPPADTHRASAAFRQYVAAATGGAFTDEDVLSGVGLQLTRIAAYDTDGFVVNDVSCKGSVLCLRDVFLLWRGVHTPADITPEKLAILDLLAVVGMGRKLVPNPLSTEVRAFLKERGIAVELMDTANASATFNILNQEGRRVAALMLPCA